MDASKKQVNYKKIYAIKAEREKRIKSICPNINNESGIYVFYRTDENGISHAYSGQALHVLERCGSHLSEYDHIALSLKKRGLFSKDNPYGWKLTFKNCPREKLDENEVLTIKHYANAGYQMLNHTGGGQGKGKSQLSDYRPPKTYQQGLVAGYKKASKEISHLFELHLSFSTKSENPSVNQKKAFEKFKDFLEFHKQKDGEE